LKHNFISPEHPESLHGEHRTTDDSDATSLKYSFYHPV
jgi:hypothetical protein